MTDNRHAKLLRAFLEEVCQRPQPFRGASWSEWARTALCAPLAVGVSLALTGCGSDSSGQPSVGERECTGDNCAVQCADGVDNDDDGSVDCDDPECARELACQGTGGAPTGGSGGTGGTHTGGTAGTGGLHTGGSGGSGGEVYAIPLEDCSNGVDDDHDEYIDCSDPDCFTYDHCLMVEYGIPF